MPYRLSLPERNAAVDGLTSLFNKGFATNPAKITIYSTATAQPVSADSGVPVGSILLSQVNFVSGGFIASVGATGVASGLPLTGGILNTGIASWFRFINPSGTLALGDGDITLTGSGGNMTFDSVSFVSGGIVNITALSITMPM